MYILQCAFLLLLPYSAHSLTRLHDLSISTVPCTIIFLRCVLGCFHSLRNYASSTAMYVLLICVVEDWKVVVALRHEQTLKRWIIDVLMLLSPEKCFNDLTTHSQWHSTHSILWITALQVSCLVVCVSLFVDSWSQFYNFSKIKHIDASEATAWENKVSRIFVLLVYSLSAISNH